MMQTSVNRGTAVPGTACGCPPLSSIVDAHRPAAVHHRTKAEPLLLAVSLHRLGQALPPSSAQQIRPR
eukprot:4531194-Prymnesium_polylepis.1